MPPTVFHNPRAIACGLIWCMAGLAHAATTVDLDFATVNSSNSTAAALKLNNVAGAIDAAGGALSNNASATAVVEINNNGSLTLNLGAMITNAGGSGWLLPARSWGPGSR